MENLKDKLGTWLKEFGYFISSKVFIKNFFSANILIFAFLFLIFQLLSCYTRNGQGVTVPDLVGKNMRQAKKDAKFLSLYVIDSTYEKSSRPNTILSQDPIGNTTVKKGRRIYLTISTTQPPLTRMPRIWGRTIEQAQRQLNAVSLTGIIVEEREDRAPGTILEVRYKGKKIEEYENRDKAPRIPRDSKVELVVASNLGVAFPVPNLVCQTYEQAQFVINGNQLKVGNLITDGLITDTLNAWIYRQIPSPPDNINAGQEVILYLQSTKPSMCVEDEDFNFLDDPNDPINDLPNEEVVDDEEEDFDEF